MAKVKSAAPLWTPVQFSEFYDLPKHRTLNKLVNLAMQGPAPTPEQLARQMASLRGSPQFQAIRKEMLEAEREFADSQWKAMIRHPVGRTLSANRHFKAALALFDRSREQAERDWEPAISPPMDNMRLWSLMAYNARLELLRTVALYADSAARGEWRRPLKIASADQRKSAHKHAKGLLQGLRNGVRISDWKVNEQLEESLTRIIRELDLNAGKRVKRSDKDSGRRAFLGGLAAALLRNCGWNSTTGLMRLAEAMGVPCNEKYAQRICNDKRKDWEAESSIVLKMRPDLIGYMATRPDR